MIFLCDHNADLDSCLLCLARTPAESRFAQCLLSAIREDQRLLDRLLRRAPALAPSFAHPRDA